MKNILSIVIALFVSNTVLADEPYIEYSFNKIPTLKAEKCGDLAKLSLENNGFKTSLPANGSTDTIGTLGNYKTIFSCSMAEDKVTLVIVSGKDYQLVKKFAEDISN